MGFLKLIIFIIITVSSVVCAKPNSEDFTNFLDGIKKLAYQQNISKDTISKTLTDIKLNTKILALDKKQPEFSTSFGKYLTNRVSDNRLYKARKYYNANKQHLAKIYQKYGISGNIIVAFLALESNIGVNTGNFNAIEALVTMAFNPRRRDFFVNELIYALKNIDSNKIPHYANSSWAGAMGSMQFMPSNIYNYALDNNNNGLNIWLDREDIFASAANFLVNIGWHKGERWGREVILPDNFDYNLSGLKNKQSLNYWTKLGITDAKYNPLPKSNLLAALILPAGYKGPAFLVYRNFYAILNWNRSILYAISVGYLSDKMITGAKLTNYPATDDYISRLEVIKIQNTLNNLGFEAGEADGIVGAKTRLAVKKFQHHHKLPADGYVNIDLLNYVNSVTQ